jgi:type IV secretory pathway VirB10-like protein
LLIGLVTLGAILFTLLLFCIMMACVKKRKPNNRNRPMTVSILPHSSHRSTTSKKIDKKAMILDTSSETSEESAQLPPYVNKKTSKVSQASMHQSRKPSAESRAAAQHQMQLQQQQQQQQQHQQQQQLKLQQQHLRQEQKKAQLMAYTVDSMTMDQRDRSLTVMIPRARYHPAPATSANGLNNMETFDHESLLSLATEAKLLNYLDASPPATKVDSFNS